MMKRNALTTQFQSWLAKPENARALDTLADAVHRKMKIARLDLYGCAPEQVDRQDIRQELIVFLLRDENMLSGLMGRKPGAIKQVRQFLWHRMIDLSRSKDAGQDIHKDTWRLFYRHVLEVLAESDDFIRDRGAAKGKMRFSMTENPAQTLIMADDFMTIAFPPDLPGEFGRLNTRENILTLARHFWSSSARAAGVHDLCMKIQDFLAWVNRHVVLQPGVESYPVTDGEKDAFNPLTERPAPGGLDNMKKNMLTVWAQNFFNRLKNTERKIFFYYDCEGLTHKAVSELMKKKAGLSYQRDKIREKLRSFLRALDWVSPDYDTKGQDGRDFEFFLLNLCDNLGSWVNLGEKG
ncbi:hypothetical protein [Desulfobacter postgatei]|uniref:Uncharacterized protein n=1 Tax=Desulfobacter postgatei 2ac9 TaxID=879212 RepID=I5B4I7_9BACT|nr:hypothetical protein [Desulfobacter postgatei]EIM64400.1 hypothetical protein DespoDRAFT_02554 [Desulfobacter postgatei 2ac9]